MKAIQFIKEHGVERARKVVESAPSNAESYQGGYYFRAKPEFQFHNGFNPVWNLTDNNGEYFKKQGFKPVDLSDLKRLVDSLDLVKEYGGIAMAKRQCACFTNACTSVGVKPSPRLSALQQAIADYESIYGGEHV